MKDDERKLWIERIEDYRSSGLTAVKWAEGKCIAVHKLRYYINKFNKEKKQEFSQESQKTTWVSVMPTNGIVEDKSSKSLKVTIGKATIEITPGFDQDTFKSLVGILSQC